MSIHVSNPSINYPRAIMGQMGLVGACLDKYIDWYLITVYNII